MRGWGEGKEGRERRVFINKGNNKPLEEISWRSKG
jgi:hypothetical protein